MSKFRRSPSFPADAQTIDAESPQDAPETSQTAESAHDPLADALVPPAEAPVPSLADLQKAYSQATAGGYQPDTLFVGGPINHDSKGFVLDVATMLDEDRADEVEAALSMASQLRIAMGEDFVELPNGSIRIPVVIDADKIVVLREWAQGAGESFSEYLAKMIDMGLEAVVNGGAIAG